MRSAFAALAVALVAGGCAGIEKERGHDDVARIVASRSGQETGWGSGAPDAEAIAAHVDALLKGGLTRERAVAIALVNSPQLQATYEELGVAQADMVQAGLLSNPTLSGSVGFGKHTREYEVSLVQSFLDLFVLPLRKKVAKAQFEADTLRVADEALRSAAEVSRAFAEVQAAAEQLRLTRDDAEAVALGAELTERQHDAGNITDLEVAEQRTAREEAKHALAHAELVLVEQREALTRLLGLWGARTEWTLAAGLEAPPPHEPPLDALEARALRDRLDVDANRKQVLLLGNAIDVTRTSRYLGVVEVGVHAHQDADGPRLLGPTLSLELPIFDDRSTMIARLEAEQRVAERRLAARSVDVRSEVRLARARLVAARALAEHSRDVLLPLHDEVVRRTQLQYNAMQIGLHQLLVARRQQLAAQAAQIDARRDYWLARADLERAVGGRLGDGEPPPATENEHVHRAD